MVRMMFMEGKTPGMGRLVIDVTGRWMCLREERFLRGAILATGLIEPGNCSSEHYTSGDDSGKHFVEIDYNLALSYDAVRRLLDVTRYNISRILSEEAVVCCCGCHADEHLLAPTLN
jgi:hypothetical protein